MFVPFDLFLRLALEVEWLRQQKDLLEACAHVTSISTPDK